MMIYLSLVMTAAVVALLVAEYADSRAGVWVAKLLAATTFVGTAIAAGALSHPYGRWILAGLVLSWFGDVFLIPREKPALFRIGILSFLLAHVAYAVAFVGLGLAATWTGAAAILFVAAGLPVGRWLAPKIPDELSAAAYAYMAVITVMVVCAAGAVPAAGAAVFVGAFGFYLSDLSVALDRFVEASFVHRLWGLPLYFGSQMVLAFTTATVGVS